MSFHRRVSIIVLSSALAATAPHAFAVDAGRAGPVAVAVDSVDVEQVAALRAGVPLVFTIFGTPDAAATLRIEGGRSLLALRETGTGVYEGTYVIDARDAIRADSRVTATLQRDGDVAYSTLGEPLLLSAATLPWNAAGSTAPAEPPDVATTAPLRVAPLPPVSPAPAAAPIPMPIPMAVAPVRRPAPAWTVAAAPSPHERALCADCALVESVQAIEVRGGGVIGAVAGAIAGAVLGKEAGEAHTRRVLGVLGAIGGAMLGREVERDVTRHVDYEVELRLADGTLLKRRYEQAPPFAAGQTIRLGAAPSRPGPLPAASY